MKSPGVIYRKYRQIKKRLLYEKIVNARQPLHCNCYYGRVIEYRDISGNNHVFNMCMFPVTFNQDPDVCFSINCNAFICKWSKEEIEKFFENELQNPEIERKLYPDLYALEWVLDKSLYEAKKDPGILGNLLINLIIFLESLLKNVMKDKTKLSNS